MDAAGAVDAQNAPTAPWKSLARFPQAPTATSTGRLQTEDNTAALARVAALDDTHATCRVAAFQTFFSGRISTFGDTVREDQRFELRGLAGPCLIRMMSGGPPGWWLERVTYKGEDVTDVPAEFASSALGQVDLLVVLTNRVQRCEVR